jgi:hypothetical protein
MGSVGIVDDADDWKLIDAEGERDTDVWECVDEICCSVNWVTDKRWLVCELLAGDIGLFTEKSI